MSCYKPLIAVDFGLDENGKHRIKFLSKYKMTCQCLNIARLREIYGDRLCMIPCGHCVGCARDRSRNWQARIMLESKYHNKMCFLTLTYKDNPPDKPSKEHLRAFIKSVRKKFGKDIKFFACGEKGEKNERSHYHVILFGVDFSEDYKPVARRGQNLIYNSPLLSNLWKYGFTSIGSVSNSSAGYVARYCDKKIITGEDSGEFVIMSRGLGKRYYQEHKNAVFSSDSIFINGDKFRIPRYFTTLADKGDLPEIVDCESYKVRKRLSALNHRFGNARSVSCEEIGMNQDMINDYSKKLMKEGYRYGV